MNTLNILLKLTHYFFGWGAPYGRFDLAEETKKGWMTACPTVSHYQIDIINTLCHNDSLYRGPVLTVVIAPVIQWGESGVKIESADWTNQDKIIKLI